jgi:hypothetical protein
MRDDVKDLLKRTFEEIKCGARTLDPVTEIEVVLLEHGFEIVKMTKRERVPFTIEE